MQRLFQARLMPGFTQSLSSEIIKLCDQYKLDNFLDYYLDHGVMPDKMPWKNIVKNAITVSENSKFEEDTHTDPEIAKFRHVHPDIHMPSPMWLVAKEVPYLTDHCFKTAKLIAYQTAEEETLLCEFYGRIFNDYVLHYALQCPHTELQRNAFWDKICNHFDVEISAYLHNLDDANMVYVLMGGPCSVIQHKNTHFEFMKYAITFLSKIMDEVKLYIEP